MEQLSNTYNVAQMKILLLGGTGWIGRNLVQQRPTWSWTALGSQQINLLDPNCIEKINEHYDLVINSAGFYGGLVFNQQHKQNILYQNLLITSNVWRLVQKLQPKKFINIGSACIYPRHVENIINESQIDGLDFHPSIEYSAKVKHIQLQLMPSLQVPWEYLILSNVYGPDEHISIEKSHFVGSLINKLKHDKNNVKMLGTGSAIRDFIYIKDVAEAICRYVELKDATCKASNISSRQGHTIEQITKKLVSIANASANIHWGDPNDNGVAYKVLNNSKMQKDINFQPEIDIDTGLAETWRWFENE